MPPSFGSPSSDPQIGGVGLIFVTGVAQNRQSVITLLENGAAMRDGSIKVGDLISSVNGRNVIGLSMDQVRELIVGPAGTMCTLTFDRPSTSTQYTVTLKRETTSQREEHQRMEQERLLVAEDRLFQMEQIKRKLEIDVERLTKQVSESRASFTQQVHALRSELQSESEIKSRLERELMQVRQTAHLPAEVEKYREENERLHSELEMAKLRLRELDRLRHELSGKEDPEDTFRTLRTRLQNALDDARNEARLKLEAESEIKNLNRKLALAGEQKSSLERSFADAHSKIVAERENLERERDGLRRQVADLKHRLEGTLSELESERTKADRFESDYRRVVGDMDEARNEQQRNLMHVRSEFDRVSNEKAALVSERSNLDRRLRDVSEELASVRMAHDRFQADLISTRDTLNTTNLVLNQTKMSLEDSVQKSEGQQSRIIDLESWAAQMTDKLTQAHSIASVAESGKKLAEQEYLALHEEFKKMQILLERTIAERDTLSVRGKEVIERMEQTHKREVFEITRQYEDGMQNVVKTSIERASAMDTELNSALSALEMRAQKDRRTALQVSDIYSSLKSAQSEIQEAETDLGAIMSRYRGRQVPLPTGLQMSFDSASFARTSSTASNSSYNASSHIRNNLYKVQKGLLA